MNKEEILAMEAGNDLNVLVATKIFNRNLPTLDQMKMIALEQWKVQPDCIHFFRGFDAWVIDGEFKWKYNEKDYSTDLSAAWEVFTNFSFPIIEKGFDEGDKDYFVCKIGNHRVIQDTAPLAICKAALLAVTDS